MKKQIIFFLLFVVLLSGNAQTVNPSLVVTLDDQFPYTPQNLMVGDVINYQIQVTNNGNVDLSGIEVDIYSRWTSSPIISSLPVGQSQTVGVTHVITQSDFDNCQVVNQATATFTHNGQTYNFISDDTDPASPAGSNDPTITLLVIVPQITLLKDDQLDYSAQNIPVGGHINYHIIATNTGNVSLSTIELFDNNATIVGSNSINNLAVGDSYIFDAVHTVSQSDIDAGLVSNQAHVTAIGICVGTQVDAFSDDYSLDPTPPQPTITHLMNASVANNYLTGLRVYPNPVTDMIHILALDTIHFITITNSVGQVVLELSPKTNQVKVNLSKLQKGIYFVKLEAKDKIETLKLIKK